MNSAGEIKTSWTWEEWQQSRPARREIAERIGPLMVRRRESSSDRRLRAAFEGKRGPEFGKEAWRARRQPGYFTSRDGL